MTEGTINLLLGKIKEIEEENKAMKEGFKDILEYQICLSEEEITSTPYAEIKKIAEKYTKEDNEK